MKRYYENKDKISNHIKKMKTISKSTLEIVHMVLFLQKDLIALLEIYLNNLFLKRVMVNGLMCYLY